jgi:hypothetical protein
MHIPLIPKLTVSSFLPVRFPVQSSRRCMLIGLFYHLLYPADGVFGGQGRWVIGVFRGIISSADSGRSM